MKILHESRYFRDELDNIDVDPEGFHSSHSL